MLDFNTYESRLFTIINNAILHSMDANQFKTQSPEEEFNELAFQIEQAKKQGYDL